MKISRRDFIKYCGVSAAALGISATELGRLEEVLANPSAPSVLWVQGTSCTGCSVSFLNRISTTAPTTAADVLLNSINLVYHPNLMAEAGDSAVALAEAAYNKGGYLLIVEGGVPTAVGGNTCWAWTYNGQDIPFVNAVTDLASRATRIISMGTCASFGGISAAPPNPTGVKSVKAATGRSTINISGCPPHPDWLVWTIVQLLLGKSIALDSGSRPTTIYGHSVHSQCPRRDDNSGAGPCLRPRGCQGPETPANCPTVRWNNGVNWCIEAEAPCVGCTRSTFPGIEPFYMNRDD